jgi:hypothetical protein
MQKRMQINTLRTVTVLLGMMAALFQGCSQPGPADLDVSNLQVIDNASGIQKKAAWNVVGKGESVLIFQIVQPLKGEKAIDFYASQLSAKGWQSCTNSSLGRWETYKDAVSKADGEAVLQYRRAYRRKDSFAEILVKQASGTPDGEKKGYLQTVMIRLTNNQIDVCR